MFVELPIRTPDGVFTARYSDAGLCAIEFPSLAKKPEASVPPNARVREWHRLTTAAVKRVLAGEPVTELPPIRIESGTIFQRKVWEAMRRIELGSTSTYGRLARSIGSPGAARAVGGACGANPIPLLIPCHRVLAAGGKLGGFTGGLEWKRRLLARELNLDRLTG